MRMQRVSVFWDHISTGAAHEWLYIFEQAKSIALMPSTLWIQNLYPRSGFYRRWTVDNGINIDGVSERSE